MALTVPLFMYGVGELVNSVMRSASAASASYGRVAFNEPLFHPICLVERSEWLTSCFRHFTCRGSVLDPGSLGRQKIPLFIFKSLCCRWSNTCVTSTFFNFYFDSEGTPHIFASELDCHYGKIQDQLLAEPQPVALLRRGQKEAKSPVIFRAFFITILQA